MFVQMQDIVCQSDIRLISLCHLIVRRILLLLLQELVVDIAVVIRIRIRGRK